MAGVWRLVLNALSWLFKVSCLQIVCVNKNPTFSDAIWMIFFEIMAYDLDSSISSSSDEDLDTLFLDTLFKPTLKVGHRLNFQALTDNSERIEMFRFVQNTEAVRLFCHWHSSINLYVVFLMSVLMFLRSPNKYRCTQGTTATGKEALMIMLRRLTYPNRWSDLVPLFGRNDSKLSLIFNTVNT